MDKSNASLPIPTTAEEYRTWWFANTDVSYGHCWCGCGRRTKLARRSNSSRLQVSGEPVRYLAAHGSQHAQQRKWVEAAREYRDAWRRDRPDIPYGYCWCGCGSKTNLTACTHTSRSLVRGEPERFLLAHAHRKSPVDYIREDRGFDTLCWIWQRAGTGEYGTSRVDGTTSYAHRLYYEEANGPILEGLLVHHRCEQTFCVNPDHLEAVTRSEHQALHKSRCIMDDSRVVTARLLSASGFSYTQIGQRLGVSRTTAQRAVEGKHGYS